MLTNADFEQPLEPARPDQARNVAKESYRRGFYQGAAAMLEAMEAGFSGTRLHAYMGRLSQWRRASTKKLVRPEWLAREKNP